MDTQAFAAKESFLEPLLSANFIMRPSQLSLDLIGSVSSGIFFLLQKRNPHQRWADGGWLWVNSLTMTYFHTGIRTIIGAESFHCPVRDGKEWDQLAMVIRLDGLASCSG